MFIDRNLDTPPEEINATPLSYYLQWVEEDAMGKLWWFAMFVIFCIIFPVVAVITIGIMLAFIMGGSALWHRDTDSRRPAWLADGFIGRSPQSLSVLYFRWWFFFGWRSFVPSSWAGLRTATAQTGWFFKHWLVLIDRCLSCFRIFLKLALQQIGLMHWPVEIRDELRLCHSWVTQ